jgi:hypothetical protein
MATAGLSGLANEMKMAYLFVSFTNGMQPRRRIAPKAVLRFRELRKRGVGKDLAAQTVGSAHGPWRIADSPALSFALHNAYFDSLGIPRLTRCR